MDIYEALDKLKQSNRIDRTARRKQLVEKKLAESSDKKPVKKLNEASQQVEVLYTYYDGDVDVRQFNSLEEAQEFVENAKEEAQNGKTYGGYFEMREPLGKDTYRVLNSANMEHTSAGGYYESLSESTNRYATKWAVVKLGYYDNGKGDGGLLYDKKKDEIVKEFEGEGNGYVAEKDAYNKARDLSDKLNKKEGKLKNGKNRYEAQPMNTRTTKL